MRAFFFGMIDFLFFDIFGSLSTPMPERIDDPSNPTRISGDPTLMDELDILLSIDVLTLL